MFPPTARRAAPWLLGLLAVLGSMALLAIMTQATPEPVLTITNRSTVPMVVAVDGERVRIIRGGVSEPLELPVAIWAQPRRIDVFAFPEGPTLLTWHADLNDLADNLWQLFIP
jgi:hypothetical protein